MSHGVKRARQSAEAIEARRLKEASKLQEYLGLQEKKKSKEWSQEAFDLTTQLLRSNPELYTVWNYRRDVMTNGLFLQRSPEEINNILASELQLTFTALKQHPKVYWIWNHRRWCLQNTPEGPGTSNSESDPSATTTDRYAWKRANWARELAVVEKMLDADARNFHAWNYRRYVVSSSPDPRSETSELAYTTRKIEANFSNFSAWHQRSKLLSALWEKGQMTDPAVKDRGDDVAVLKREISVIEELLEIEPGTKWCIECLVHYKRILMRHEPENADKLKEECLAGLETLHQVDPHRRRRYEELAKTITGSD
ncbi:Rab geranylgeranyltransferase [Tulasnella sp. 403]|nr:Rab geranylgeranyltransferase [Tulasnella sp. 403]